MKFYLSERTFKKYFEMINIKLHFYKAIFNVLQWQRKGSNSDFSRNIRGIKCIFKEYFSKDYNGRFLEIFFQDLHPLYLGI